MKIVVKSSPGWRKHDACTLGVSVRSPNWQGPYFAAILAWAAEHFRHIRIDVTDALGRHNYMAQGLPPDTALDRANADGALWLALHQHVIDACPVPVRIARWAEWYAHPDYHRTLAAYQRAYELNPVLRDAVHKDIDGYYSRAGHHATLIEREHSKNYLLEELAVITIYGREMPSAHIYPGTELECSKAVKAGLVPEVPQGLAREHFTRIKFTKTAVPGHLSKLKIA